MINSLQQDYNDAVARGDTQAIKYLSVIMGGVQNDPVAANSVGLGTNTPSNGTQTPMAGDNPVSGFFGGIINGVFGAGSYDAGGAVKAQGDATAAAIGNAASGVANGLSFITDIPRVATTLIGGLMIAAGLFALAGGTHTQIIQLVKKP